MRMVIYVEDGVVQKVVYNNPIVPLEVIIKDADVEEQGDPPYGRAYVVVAPETTAQAYREYERQELDRYWGRKV